MNKAMKGQTKMVQTKMISIKKMGFKLQYFILNQTGFSVISDLITIPKYQFELTKMMLAEDFL